MKEDGLEPNARLVAPDKCTKQDNEIRMLKPDWRSNCERAREAAFETPRCPNVLAANGHTHGLLRGLLNRLQRNVAWLACATSQLLRIWRPPLRWPFSWKGGLFSKAASRGTWLPLPSIQLREEQASAQVAEAAVILESIRICE